MPPQETPNSTTFPLSRTPEGLVYTEDTLTYRITGLSPHNLDRLRVTLKASCQSSVISSELKCTTTDN